MSDESGAPTFHRIIVDIPKLRDYCLSSVHSHGRHKARVFCARLGLEAKDAEFLRELLVNAVRQKPDHLVPTKTDHHGAQHALDFEVSTGSGTAMVRSIWIVPVGKDDVLRFVTCYVR